MKGVLVILQQETFWLAERADLVLHQRVELKEKRWLFILAWPSLKLFEWFKIWIMFDEEFFELYNLFLTFTQCITRWLLRNYVFLCTYCQSFSTLLLNVRYDECMYDDECKWMRQTIVVKKLKIFWCFQELFCIVSHLEERKKCFWCDSSPQSTLPALNHRIENVVYRMQPG